MKFPKIPFSKYSGCGNVFVLIDERTDCLPKKLVPAICRKESVDGVITLQESQLADYCMRIFNADGTEAEMCGNGLRCFGMFLKELGAQEDAFTIEVMGNIYPLKIHKDSVTVDMIPPQDIRWQIRVNVDGRDWHADYLDTGVPHLVLFVEDIEKISIKTLGRALRNHPDFAPRGVNVDFVSLSIDGKLSIRTYERGVEAETLACGTGAFAAAVSGAKHFGLKSPITVATRSGENLTFDFNLNDKVVMEGPAHKLFSGFLC